MKTSNSSIFEALSLNNTSFFIPPYQRAYSWGKEQINRFFDDVMRLVQSEQDPMQKDKQQHFFGTLVYKWEGQGSFAKRQVIIDGQQRLTTTLIFCIALRDLSTDQEEKQNITNTLLINEKSTFKDKIKLKQVTSDWDAYGALVMGGKPVPGKITDAYNLFIRLLRKQLENEDITAEHFITALQRINVAIIELSEEPYKGEDPQVIFETLNSLGKPLSLSDLIRNYILLGMPSDQQTTIYDEVWQPKIEQPLGEVGEEYTSRFFRDYLQCKKKKSYKVVSDNNTKELYYQFKEYVECTFDSKKDFIRDIESYVPCYLNIVEPKYYTPVSPNKEDDQTIKELLHNIFHDISSEAFKPFVLELLHMRQCSNSNTTIYDTLLIESLESIRTYLIRRRVVKLTQAENKNIPTLTSYLPAIASGETSLIKILSNLFYRLRLPNDKEIRETLERLAFYKDVSSYSKFILGEMEKHQAKVSVDFHDPLVTIEHIMPQTLNEVWRSELGEEHAEEIHQHYLHNIGNLILTEFNGEMGNKSFADKKARLATSNIGYSYDICQYERWSEESILDHQDRMISLFLDTFSLPEEYKQTNNWKDDSDQKTESVIYPFDGSLGWAKGTKPKQLRIYQQTYEVKNWSGTLLQFVKYFKYQEPAALEELILNQQEVFSRKDSIVNWSRFSQLLLKQPNYQTRYKNLEDKFCTQLSDIKPEELFVHCDATINMILDRMSKAMLLLGMDRKDVVIELRRTAKSSITIEEDEE